MSFIPDPFDITCCFTGHRPPKLGGYNIANNPKRAAVFVALRKAVGQAIEDGYRTFISGMALGTDQDAFEVVLEYKAAEPSLGIRLIAAIPFLGQEDPWPPHSQQHYRLLLTHADDKVLISPPPADNWEANRFLDVRNHWMVDQSSRIIAVFDGTKGGTFNCLKYAWELEPKRQFTVINPELALRPGYELETLE